MKYKKGDIIRLKFTRDQSGGLYDILIEIVDIKNNKYGRKCIKVYSKEKDSGWIEGEVDYVPIEEIDDSSLYTLENNKIINEKLNIICK
jgi:hypothetical protein